MIGGDEYLTQKRYYWLKLKKDFFKRHDIKIIESMPNGKDYVLFYLKLLVESVDHNGNLRFNDTIPYDENMLSVITNTNIDIVKSAMKLFTELKMVEILEDSTIFMREVEKMLGSETYWAEQKRLQRNNEIKTIGQSPENVQSMSNMSNQEIDIEKDIDIDIDIDIDNISSCPKLKFSDEQMELAELLLSLIKQNNPNYRMVGPIEKWANEVRLMVERDKRTLEQIRQIIEWSQQDSFWKTNILSMSKLRKQFDQLTMHKKRGEQYGKPISQANTPRLKTEAERYNEYN